MSDAHGLAPEGGEQGEALLPASGHRGNNVQGPGDGAVISLRGISKRYPGVQALSAVDLDLLPGQVHALVGENGAGKSTLLKIIAGMATPDSGSVYIDGEAQTIHSTHAARRFGISAVPQELSLVSHLSVAENICVTALPGRGGFVSKRALRREARAVLDLLGLDIDPLSQLDEHGPGVQELVMIGRGLIQDARVLVLDEPTAALTAPEIDHLFDVIEAAKRRGTAFLYVSHRLQELARVAEMITVLRDGLRVVTGPAGQFDHDTLVRAMVGRSDDAFARSGTPNRRESSRANADPTPRLRVQGLTRRGAFENVSFSVAPGEIVGLAGLIGAGRTEVARAIFGVDHLDSGSIELDGKRVKIRSPRGAVRAGLAMVPEERKSQALVLGMSVEANLTITHLSSFARNGWVQRRRERQAAQREAQKLDIRAASTAVSVGSLSGGNQQKVVIGRWLLGSHRMYMFDEPTRGVDVGAKFAIYELLRKLRHAGAGLLVISSELLELMNVCDRVLVMREGQLVSDLKMDESVTEEQILRWAIRPGAVA